MWNSNIVDYKKKNNSLDNEPFNFQNLIYLVILLSVSHTVLVMLV